MLFQGAESGDAQHARRRRGHTGRSENRVESFEPQIVLSAPHPLNHGDLDGSNGFVLDGSQRGGALGATIAGADVDHDGLADLLAAAPDGTGEPSAINILFGATQRPASVVADTSLDGQNRLIVSQSVPIDRLGLALESAGDFNGDATKISWSRPRDSSLTSVTKSFMCCSGPGSRFRRCSIRRPLTRCPAFESWRPGFNSRMVELASYDRLTM